jgi:hypothetical protein
MALTTLRDALCAAGFTGPRVRKATSLVEYVTQPELRAAIASLQLQESCEGDLAALVALFGFGEPLPRRQLERLCPQLDLDGLARLGLVGATGESVVAHVRLTEFDGLFFAYDIEPERRPDMVVGISESSRVVAAYTPLVDVEAALDLGTGCGVHALLASRHASRVVATDVNPRALQLTALNARLNGIGNVEIRQGSLFEPVVGERFELVVANLPYVISPDTRFLYRDAGIPGDALSRRVLRELPTYLVEGGLATLQGNWTHGRDSPWWSPLEHDLRSAGCDAYLLRRDTQDPLAYAVGWLSRPAPHEVDEHAATVSRWRESYREGGIEAITTMVIILRRRTGANWCYAVTEERQPRPELAGAIGRLFATQDSLADGLPVADLRPAPGLVVETRTGVGKDPDAILECPLAFGTRHAVSPAAASFVLGKVATPRADLEPELRKLAHLGYLIFR